MKKILLSLFGFILLIHQTAFANGSGLPAYLKINGKYSMPNPLQLFGITAQSFLIPQDYTVDNYIVNQPINFEIDSNQLLPVIPDEDVLKHNKYEWKFGDGQIADGLTNTHTYTKVGSYILVLTINVYPDPNQAPTQFIDSFLLNILPSKYFHDLPKAVIKINNKEISDPINNILRLDLSKGNYFDATASQSQSGLEQYYWNFGDGQTSSKAKDTHTYSSTAYDETVVLRVIDKYGFISDAFVGLKNDLAASIPTLEENPRIKIQTPVNNSLNHFFQGIIIPFVVIAGVIVAYLYSKKQKSPKNNKKY